MGRKGSEVAEISPLELEASYASPSPSEGGACVPGGVEDIFSWF